MIKFRDPVRCVVRSAVFGSALLMPLASVAEDMDDTSRRANTSPFAPEMPGAHNVDTDEQRTTSGIRSRDVSRDALGDRAQMRSDMTAEEQSNSQQDLALTRQIRQAIAEDDSLSTTAKNVKIISREGRVTLSGAVSSTTEKDRVEQIAERYAGAARVNNELQLATSAQQGQRSQRGMFSGQDSNRSVGEGE